MIATIAALFDFAALDNGIVFGAVYGIIGLGIVLIFRANRILHLSLAETGMVGAFVFYELWALNDWNYLLAAICGVIVSGLLTLALRLWLTSIENNRLLMVIGTLGATSIILYFVIEFFGKGTDAYAVPPVLEDFSLSFWDLTFRGPDLMVLIASAVLGIAFFVLFRYTRAGLTFRAAALDPLATELMGVNVSLLRAGIWTIAGMLSALAAILVLPLSTFTVFFMSAYLVRALTCALLGGMVSIPGTIIAGITLGIVEAQLKSQSTDPGRPELVLVIFVIVFLVVRAGKGITRGATVNEEPLVLAKQGK